MKNVDCRMQNDESGLGAMGNGQWAMGNGQWERWKREDLVDEKGEVKVHVLAYPLPR
jgi:hypothetical protein